MRVPKLKKNYVFLILVLISAVSISSYFIFSNKDKISRNSDMSAFEAAQYQAKQDVSKNGASASTDSIIELARSYVGEGKFSEGRELAIKISDSTSKESEVEAKYEIILSSYLYAKDRANYENTVKTFREVVAKRSFEGLKNKLSLYTESYLDSIFNYELPSEELYP